MRGFSSGHRHLSSRTLGVTTANSVFVRSAACTCVHPKSRKSSCNQFAQGKRARGKAICVENPALREAARTRRGRVQHLLSRDLRPRFYGKSLMPRPPRRFLNLAVDRRAPTRKSQCLCESPHTRWPVGVRPGLAGRPGWFKPWIARPVRSGSRGGLRSPPTPPHSSGTT